MFGERFEDPRPGERVTRSSSGVPVRYEFVGSLHRSEQPPGHPPGSPSPGSMPGASREVCRPTRVSFPTHVSVWVHVGRGTWRSTVVWYYVGRGTRRPRGERHRHGIPDRLRPWSCCWQGTFREPSTSCRNCLAERSMGRIFGGGATIEYGIFVAPTCTMHCQRSSSGCRRAGRGSSLRPGRCVLVSRAGVGFARSSSRWGRGHR